MKRIFVVLSLVLLVSIVQAQRFRVSLEAVQTCLNFDDDDPDWSDWMDVKVLSTIDFDEGRVNLILDDDEMDYIMYGEPTKKDKVDKDGDKYFSLLSKALDNEGDKCVISLDSWSDYNIIIISVYYDDWAFCYQGKLL